MDMEQTFKEIAEVTGADVSMEAVMAGLFGGTATTLTLRDERVVTFKEAKVKEVAVITRLFQRLLDSIPRDKFATMLQMIVDSQVQAMADGKSQNDLSLNATKLIEEALGENSLLLTVFSNVIDMLPDAIPHFTDISKEIYEDLSLDEAVCVAAGVVAVNYGFFTRTLPPLLKSIIGAWKKKGDMMRSTSGQKNGSTSLVRQS